MVGRRRHRRQQLVFDYLPKLDKPYDMLQAYELMNEGKIHGYICQGFNPLASAPNKGKLISAFSKLKFMVSMDPLEPRPSPSGRTTVR